MLIPFTKMHGLGNDFMVLDRVNNSIHLTGEQIRKLADRHFGVGFDQLLVVDPPSSDNVDFDYRIYNADGNEVEHCGNGARCFALFVRQHGLTNANPVTVNTLGGILKLQCNADDTITVNMGEPRLEPEVVPYRTTTRDMVYTLSYQTEHGVQSVEFSALSLGNPHAVILVEEVDTAPVEQVGRMLNQHADFPSGVNVGFMQITNRHSFRLRVFERGVGETLACGTGACAAAVAGSLRGLLDTTVEASLRGGKLTISWEQGSNPVFMTGPACTVFEGRINL